MTTYYVDGATGSDSNNTTQAQSPSTPWLTIAHALATIAGGDWVHAKASAIYWISSRLDLVAGTTSAYTRLMGYIETPGDGGRATIRTTAAITAISTYYTQFTSVENFVIDGNSGTGTTGVDCTNAAVLIQNCWIKDFSSGAATMPFGLVFRMIDCEVSGCGGTNGAVEASAPAHISNCSIHDNSSAGIYSETLSLRVARSKVYGNTSHGIYAKSDMLLDGCTIHGNSGDGVRVDNQAVTLVRDSVLTLNGGYGINLTGGFASAGYATLDYNWFGSGSLANVSGPRSANASAGLHDLSGDPQYVNAGTGDLTPQNAAVRAASNNGWIGAVQPTPSGGVSGPVARPTIVQNIGTY